jgi:hypothetical protein
MKLRRPRFSLRTLLVVVTLTCVYFAAWEVTKRKGVAAVQRLAVNKDLHPATRGSSPMPFLVRLEPPQLIGPGPWTVEDVLAEFDGSFTYFWFFGWTWEIPGRWNRELHHTGYSDELIEQSSFTNGPGWERHSP